MYRYNIQYVMMRRFESCRLLAIGQDLWAVATLHLSPVCGRPEQYAVPLKHQDALGLI